MATTNNWFLILDEGANTWATSQVEETSPEKDSASVTYNVSDFQTVYTDSASITYNVGSVTGQIIGGGSFPFVGVTADVLSNSNILTTAAQNDYIGAYSLRQGIDTQSYIAYNVRAGAEKDLVPTYNRGGPTEVQGPDITYNVLEEILKDLSDSYEVSGAVTSDRACTYELFSSPLTATSLVEPTWDIITSVETDTIVSYTCFTGLEKDTVQYFYIFEFSTKDTSQTYDVASSASSDSVVTFDLFGFEAVTQDVTATYRLDSEIVVMPNVVGMPLSKATSTIESTGLTIGTVTYVTLQ